MQAAAALGDPISAATFTGAAKTDNFQPC